MRSNFFLFFYIFIFFSFCLRSQNYLEIGDKFYHHNNFKQAISYFEKESQNTDPHYKLLASQRLANVYTHIHNFELAEKWLLSALVLEPENTTLLMQYADILKKSKRLDEAKKYYSKCYSIDKLELTRLYSEFCDTLKHYEGITEGHYEVTEFKVLNSAFRDFSPVIEGDSIYLVSDRESKADGNKGILKHKYAIPHLDLYVAGFNPSSNDYSLINPIPFSGIKTGHHEGPLAFSDSGKTLTFTRTITGLKTHNQHIHPTQIFISKFVNGSWTKPSNSFAKNDLEHSTGHPSISQDGKMMVFMADEGSNFSNSNIFTAKWNANAQIWSDFRPLGDNINSIKNELFPFLDKHNNLYFASNGWPGYGGLDLFIAKYDPLKDDWETPVNLKYPINSEWDDYSLFLYNNCNCGMISSNREGGTGNDDIYLFSKTQEDIFLDYHSLGRYKTTFFNGTESRFSSANAESYTILQNADLAQVFIKKESAPVSLHVDRISEEINRIEVTINPNSPNVNYSATIRTIKLPIHLNGTLRTPNNQIVPHKKLYVFENEVLTDTLTTNNEGSYSLLILPERSYKIVWLNTLTKDFKPKYLNVEILNSKNEKLNNTEISITYSGSHFAKFSFNKSFKPIRIPNNGEMKLSFSKKYHLSFDTLVNIDTYFDQDTIHLRSRLKEIPSYIIKGIVFEEFNKEKLPIPDVDIEFLYRGKNIDQSKSFENGEFEIRAYPQELANLSLTKKGYVSIDTTFLIDSVSQKNKIFQFEMNRITAGATVQLKEIYFHYNKAEIDKESFYNLEKIAKFLLANPGMKVELAAHTDIRGNDQYNMDLSQKRAEAVVKFLQQRGVKLNQMKAKGYGSSQRLIKDATTEEEHQVNRRTEIKILKIDNIQGEDFEYRLVLKSTKRPLNTSDEIFLKFPLLKSTSFDNNELLYFIGPFKTIEEVKNAWNKAIEQGFSEAFTQKTLRNIVIAKIANVSDL